MNEFKVGDKVRIWAQPGCKGEYRLHGLAELNNDIVGMIVGFNPIPEPTEHEYKVGADYGGGRPGDTQAFANYYRADELRLIESKKQSVS